jgi:hypothetical protein
MRFHDSVLLGSGQARTLREKHPRITLTGQVEFLRDPLFEKACFRIWSGWMCSTSLLPHPPASAPYVVVRLIVNLMRSSNSNFTLTFIVNPGMLVITPVPVITTSTRTRRTYSSHHPTDRNAVIPRRRYASRRASSLARRAALLERRYQFFDTARPRLALMLSVFVERFIEHRFLAPTIGFFSTSSRPISSILDSRNLSFLSSPGRFPSQRAIPPSL